MNAQAYDTLRQLTDSGRLEVVHLVAPPRSSSTALERALSHSPDVDAQINDPWSLYDKDREARTYEYVLERVEPLLPPQGAARIAIKNIADYIPPGEAWDRMTALARHTIFLVRQPLLTTESMMQIMAQEVSPADGEAYAKQHGYKSWAAMRQEVSLTRDYRPYEGLYRRLFQSEQPIHQLPEMQVPVVCATPLSLMQRLGYDTHDAYAVHKGFASWEQLCGALASGEASARVACAEVAEANFACRITGWTALWQHFNRMSPGDSVDVVDATMFRALPALFLPDVFERAGLRFSSEVIAWDASSKQFNPDYDGAVPYYDKVIQSSGVAPPTETPVAADRFPGFIQDSLVGNEGALDIYERFLRHITARLSTERWRALQAATVNGVPLQQIDPVFYELLNKKG